MWSHISAMFMRDKQENNSIAAWCSNITFFSNIILLTDSKDRQLYNKYSLY